MKRRKVMKHTCKLLIILTISILLIACAPSIAKEQKDTKAAILTMYYPDEHVEKFRFIYNDKSVFYHMGNYGSEYYYNDSNMEKVAVVKVGSESVYYRNLEQEEYNIFNGTFTVQNESVMGRSSENDDVPYIAICDICKQEIFCRTNRISICPTCGTEHFPIETH